MSLIVNAAEYNSRKMLDRKFSLPAAAGTLAPARSGAASTGGGNHGDKAVAHST